MFTFHLHCIHLPIFSMLQMGKFLDRLKNFGSKVLGGIKSIGEKVIPVAKKMAPYAAEILKSLPFGGTAIAGKAIEKYADPVLTKAESLMR